MPESSLAQSVALLPEKERLKAINRLNQTEAEELIYDWEFWARPKQLPPIWDWYIWLLLSGRGGGKTRTGAELTVKWAREGFSPIALVGQTKADVRDTMVEVGDSAILNICPPWFRPDYESSKRRLTFPNGVLAIIYSGDEPDQLRGPQHCFVAGTMITTPYGEKPIETIKQDDYVLTRRGYHRIVETFDRYAEVGRVKFSNGKELVATAQHPVLQLNGWMRISTLTQGEKICTGEKLLTDISQPTSVARKSISTDGFGSRQMVLSQKVLKFITKIRSRFTTILITCFSRQSHRIADCTTKLGKELWLSAKIAGQTLPGLEITPVPQFAGVANLNEQRNGGNLIGYAKSAELPINHVSETPIKETSVASVVSIWEHVGRARVYNLTVEGCPEYIANGIIVHNCKAWVDELSKFKYPQDTWDNLMFGLRIGNQPQAVVTTTPRPIKAIKALMQDKRAAVTRGHTLENKDNLSPDFLRYILGRYEGTRLGRQELAGEILDDNPEALWQRAQIDELRVNKHQDLKRVVVAIDPQGTDNETSASTGIVVAGIAQVGEKIHGYILADLTLSGTPERWASAAVAGYHTFKADRIVAEVNFGGDMVESVIRIAESGVAFKKVHASRGKEIRAEPVSALYEQGRVHHVGFFPELEDQLCEWVPGDKSPDRLDALVWALTELMLQEQPSEWRRL